MSKVPKYIIDAVRRRRMYQARANDLTLQIDKYLEKNNIDFEYVCSHVALFCEPATVETQLLKLLTTENNQDDLC